MISSKGRLVPIVTVLASLIVVWYFSAVGMNWDLQKNAFENANNTTFTVSDIISGTLNQERPRLPAPHQIVSELNKSVLQVAPDSKRSLVHHSIVTLEATLLGFAIGSLSGIMLAMLIVHLRSLDKSLMPWIVASQTIPIIALAPMIVVILNQFDITGVVPKAVIAAYLSFFPVTVGMVKGLRSPDLLQMGLMRTYHASRLQAFFKLRLPSSVPFLFASLKVAVAASLVGAVVAEITKSEDGGLGARLLAGSYYGQTIQIWAALLAAASVAAGLVILVGGVERFTSKAMGARV